jgi:hypothetical protein
MPALCRRTEENHEKPSGQDGQSPVSDLNPGM